MGLYEGEGITPLPEMEWGVDNLLIPLEIVYCYLSSFTSLTLVHDGYEVYCRFS